MSQIELEANLNELVKKERAAQKRSNFIYMLSALFVFGYCIFISHAASKTANYDFILQQVERFGASELESVNLLLIQSAPKIAKATIDLAESKLMSQKNNIEGHMALMVDNYVSELAERLTTGSAQATVKAGSVEELKARYTQLFEDVSDKNQAILEQSFAKSGGSMVEIKQALADLNKSDDQLTEKQKQLKNLIGASLAVMDHKGVEL